MAFAKGWVGVDAEMDGCAGEVGDGCWGVCGRDAVFDVFFFLELGDGVVDMYMHMHINIDIECVGWAGLDCD